MLQAMQFQVNPHFLYNTLEIINSQAIIKGEWTISRMTTALADMFRYSVESNNDQITLDDEMKNIKSFIDIQQERFRDLHVEFLLMKHHLPM
ncbi:histidine kinase [Bacillus sp. N9]